MKKLIFGLIATVMFGLNGSAQTSKSELEKTYGLLTKQDISAKNLVASDGVSKDMIIPVFIEQQKAWIIIIYNDKGIVNLYNSPTIKPQTSVNEFITTLNQNRAFANKCETMPSDMGVILCSVKTLVSGIACIFGFC